MNYTPESYPVDVVFADTQMDKIDLRFLLSNVIMVPDGEEILDTAFSFAAVAQFLYSSPLLRPSAWRALMEVGSPMFWASSEDHCRRIKAWTDPETVNHLYPLAPLSDDLPPVYHVIVVDGQWVTWTGNVFFLELESGEMIPKLKCPGVEEVTYNLTELTRREWTRCINVLAKRRGGGDAGNKGIVREAEAASGVD